MRTRIALTGLFATLMLAACGGGSDPEPPPPPPSPPPPPTPVALEWIKRDWKFQLITHTAPAFTDVGDLGFLTGTGVVNDERILGGLSPLPDGVPPGARVHVYSSNDGHTYWVGAQAPDQDREDPTRVASVRSELNQYQYFIKSAPNASLNFTVSQAYIELIDRGEDLVPVQPHGEECGLNFADDRYCGAVVEGDISLAVRAYNYDTDREVFMAASVGIFSGYHRHWGGAFETDNVPQAIWTNADFEFDRDVDGNGIGDHARATLRAPITVNVPLADIPVGDMFVLHTKASALANDERHGYTYAAAFLRDPQASGGVGMSYSGLTPVDAPAGALPDYQVPEASECTGPADPAAGVIEFRDSGFEVNEYDDYASILVSRSGGTEGFVSATFSTEDDTGTAGTHYEAVSTTVAFADGQGGTRRIRVPIIADDVTEDARIVVLRLTNPRGCAALGSNSSTSLTIVDDDPPPPPIYTVYVNVSGLAGTGLVIEDAVTGANILPATNGAHALGYPYSDGGAYDVRVLSQPLTPDQICTVSGGSGRVAAADVRSVDVSCETPPPTGGLDLSFGVQGKVSLADLPTGRAVVVQSDGRIVVLAGLWLARFMPDGTADPTFGTNGRVPVVFTGGFGEEANGLALQPDDKLVVVGRARAGTRYDMAAVRHNADGTLDTGFGVAGLSTVNPYLSVRPEDGTVLNHQANRVMIVPDGTIYMAGVAGWRDLQVVNHVNFAVARLLADGSIDTGFGGDGSAAPVTNGSDVAYGLALQSDGRLVVAGAANNSMGLGLARFRPNGQLDTDNPRVVGNFGRDGAGTVFMDEAPQGGLGPARDIVMLDDDRFIVAASVSVPHATLGFVSQIELVECSPDGLTGATGLYTMTPVGPDNDVANQLLRLPDGRMLLAAQVSSGTVADFGVLRYNPDRTLDVTFGGSGIVTVDFHGARDGASALAVAPDGGIIAVGAARNGSSEWFAMTRIRP